MRFNIKCKNVLIFIIDIFQKLTSYSADHREIILQHGAHKSLVMLLSARDVTLLHCALYALHDLAQRYGRLQCPVLEQHKEKVKKEKTEPRRKAQSHGPTVKVVSRSVSDINSVFIFYKV